MVNSSARGEVWTSITETSARCSKCTFTKCALSIQHPPSPTNRRWSSVDNSSVSRCVSTQTPHSMTPRRIQSHREGLTFHQEKPRHTGSKPRGYRNIHACPPPLTKCMYTGPLNFFCSSGYIMHESSPFCSFEIYLSQWSYRSFVVGSLNEWMNQKQMRWMNELTTENKIKLFVLLSLAVLLTLLQDIQATITNSWHEFYFTMDSEKNKETPAQKLKP